ncbi:indolepyruvate/phenylpyruvate decarboxylase [soil metagenome]
MNLTEYLFDRLRERGVSHTFGIPGDFVLPVYAVQEAVGMPTIVCAHEPGVGFAADTYARRKGLGVALVTYGAGALNLVNAVACAYAEQSPLLVVSGGPEVFYRRPDVYLHHVVRDFESQLRIFREITVDAAILDDPATAPAAIDRVLRQVIRRQRPGYLEIPRDRVTAEVVPPSGPLDLEDDPEEAGYFTSALDEALEEMGRMLSKADRPALYVGVGVRRHGLTGAVVRLAERLKLPVATDVLGKASFPESHPQFAGVYMGALGDPTARALLDGSDCVLSLGVVRTDTSTGFWTERIDPAALISVEAEAVRIRFHRYDNLPIARVVTAMGDRLPPSDRQAPAFSYTPEPPSPRPGPGLRIAEVISAVVALDQAEYSFVADVGDSWFVGLELRADVFLAPGFYASMGFAVPGALGAGIADPSRRPFVLVGDGAFQMTGTELATLVDQNLRPIVLLLNNSSYGMLEALDRPHRYYDRRPWDYPAMARALGCPAERAETAAQLLEALARAKAAEGPYLIEAVVSKEDLSPVMGRIRSLMEATRSARIRPTPMR